MKCKNCNEGLVLKISEETIPPDVAEKYLSDTVVKMNAVACDCCGGYFEDCENCKAGKKIIKWVDDLPNICVQSDDGYCRCGGEGYVILLSGDGVCRDCKHHRR